MAFQQYPQKGGIPSGTTAQRPSNPVVGDTFYNGELGLLEIYTSVGWTPNSAPSGTPAIAVFDEGANRFYEQGPAFRVDITPSLLGGFATGYTVSATSTVTSSIYSGASSSTSIVVPTFASSSGYNAAYTINAASYNGFGSSPYISGSVIVTTKPEKIATVAATISNGSNSSATVTWVNKATGGKNLTSIKINAYINGTLSTSQTAATTSSTSHVVTGLTAGTTYTFKVAAVNANGDGDLSVATNAVTIPSVAFDALIVAGGGGGSDIIGGGGGAGGMREVTGYCTLGTAITLTVGAGGRGGKAYSSGTENQTGFPGFNSVIGDISATGGGGAAGWDGAPATFPAGQQAFRIAGGSGGGGSSSYQSGTGGAGNLGAYTPVEGYEGGNGSDPYGSGGGGASQPGRWQAAHGNINGGAGRASTITGSSVTYAGGGGGGRRTSNAGSGPSSGGSGGGGAGMAGGSFSTNQNGTANLGGGGGGGNYPGPGGQDQAGGNGGSGIVIIKIPNTRSATFSAGVTQSLSTAVSGYKIYSITAAGSSDTVTIS